MNFQKLVEALNTGVVLIWFTSLNSGDELEGHYTLKNRHIGKVNPDSSKIPAFNVCRNRWEDIEVFTINKWVKVPNSH